MPRLSPTLLRHAANRSAHLARLLRECRDLESATNELRWLGERAYNHNYGHGDGDVLRRDDDYLLGLRYKLTHLTDMSVSDIAARFRLARYVRRRAAGEPLQYILGNAPFGELDIICRRNVLIPRPETELYTTTLAGILGQMREDGVDGMQDTLRIADLCTGSGCIALLLHSLMCPVGSDVDRGRSLDVIAVDVSEYALRLARDNLEHNIEARLLSETCRDDVSFEHVDVLKLGEEAKWMNEHGVAEADNVVTRWLKGPRDVIISNPPYISPSDYAPGGTVSRSVRSHEPKLALVPPASTSTKSGVLQADRFYEAVLHTALQAAAKVVVLEVGDSNQASRVRRLAEQISIGKTWIETWRDDASIDHHGPGQERHQLDNTAEVANERAVVVWTGSWAEWRSKHVSCR